MSEKTTPRDTDFTPDERGRYVVRPDWIGQAILINVGLLVLSVYIAATLIGAGANDIASRVAIVALVVAMPLLAVLSLTTELQRSRRYASFPWYFVGAQAIAQGTAVIGFGAALWHVWYVASIVLVVSGVAGLFLYQAYYRRLNTDNESARTHRKTR